MTYLGSVGLYTFFYNDRNLNYAVFKNKERVANPSTQEELFAYMSKVGKKKNVI